MCIPFFGGWGNAKLWALSYLFYRLKKMCLDWAASDNGSDNIWIIKSASESWKKKQENEIDFLRWRLAEWEHQKTWWMRDLFNRQFPICWLGSQLRNLIWKTGCWWWWFLRCRILDGINKRYDLETKVFGVAWVLSRIPSIRMFSIPMTKRKNKLNK
jgi:hypothetical protein